MNDFMLTDRRSIENMLNRLRAAENALTLAISADASGEVVVAARRYFKNLAEESKMQDITMAERKRETAEELAKMPFLNIIQRIGVREDHDAGTTRQYVLRLDTEAIKAIAQDWLDARQAAKAE